MAQTVILTVEDNGVSNVLGNILDTMKSVANMADSLSAVTQFVGDLRNEKTLLGQAFNSVKKALGDVNLSLKAKGLSLGKVGLAIAAVIAIVIGLIAWWRDLGDRNAELKERFMNIWNSIRDTFDNGVVAAINQLKQVRRGKRGTRKAEATLVRVAMVCILLT